MTDAAAGHIATFEVERPRLLGLGYRMLGSLTDAEDVVQEAWLRWDRTDPATIDNPAAWLTTVTTRLALDRVRTIERRRKEYVGPWLPEPVAFERGPEETAEVADSLTLGFLVVLDRLTPTERAVFLLADVFAEPFAAVAGAVGKSEENCRQIATRARRKVRDERVPGATPIRRETLEALMIAIATGEIDQVLALLDTDVTLVSDSGAGRHAARRVVVGPARVARLMRNVGGWVLNGTKPGYELASADVLVTSINGAAAFRVNLPDGPYVFTGDERNGKIVVVRTMLNPDKLTHIDEPATLR
jgi:RNA polymerase sigma-70 factor (ECF subfamily)